MDTSAFQPGELVDQRVRIISVIGSGSMGYVYKAEQTGVERPVAVKALHRSRLSDTDAIARFLREAKLISALHHENIVQVFSVSVTPEGQPYFVMEFLEGETLSAFAAAGKLNSFDVFFNIFSQVCNGLAHAHERGIVHRDLKPGNIIVCTQADGNLSVKLVDFGIAKLMEQDEGQQLTRAGTIIGSPAYMSPEQCMGRTLDARSDIYSLGCVMYEAVSGLPPFTDTSASIFRLHIAEPPPPWNSSKLRLTVPKDLQAVVKTALEKNPQNRYASALAVLEDLVCLKEHRKPQVVAAAKSTQGKPLIGSRQARVLVSTLAVTILIVSGVALYAANERKASDAANELIALGDREYKGTFSLRCGHETTPTSPCWERAYNYYKQSGKGGDRLAILCFDRAERFADRKMFERADECFVEAYKLRQQYPSPDKAELPSIEMQWGRECVAAGKYSQGQRHLESAFTAMKSLDAIDNKKMILLLQALQIAYKFQGNLDGEISACANLIDYQKKYDSAPDIIANNLDHYADLLIAAKRPAEADNQRKAAAEFRTKFAP